MKILKLVSLSKKSLALAGLLAATLPLAMSGQAKALDTLSLRRGEALSTNYSAPRLYGQPRMTVSRHDVYNRDQQFEIRDMRDGTFQFRQHSTNKCLNSYRPSRGSLVNVWDCQDDDMDQRFTQEQVGNRVLLKSKLNPSVCLDASHVERGLVHMYDCNPSNENQLWKINPIINNPARNLPSVVTIVNHNTNTMMDGGADGGGEVYGHSEHLKNSYQQWELRPVGNYYMLINKQTGRALDAGGGNTNNSQMNAYMHPHPMHHNDYHLWRIEDNGTGRYLIISKATGFALDGGGANVGQDSIYLFQRPNRYNSWHQWKIEGVGGADSISTGTPNPTYSYRESDYLFALYRDRIGNSVSHRDGDHSEHVAEAIDSSDGQSDRRVHALVGGEVVAAKNGVFHDLIWSRDQNKRYLWTDNGTVAIYNRELDKTFIYWHFAEGSVNLRVGDTVQAGDLIGIEGATGYSFGVHTHVQVHNGRGPNYATAARLRLPDVFEQARRQGLTGF